jgi:branched-chain amino acid aminotransferase
MRVCIVKNGGTAFAGSATDRLFDLVAMTTDLTDWGDSMRLCVIPGGRFAASPYSRTKVLSWAFNLNWYQAAHERGFDEVILLNEREEVSECTSANIYAAFGNDVYTPPLESGCLPGITREILLTDLLVPGIRLQERTLTLADLVNADEVFVTSSTRDVLPVAEIEGIQLKSGNVSGRLRTAFREYIKAYTSSHVNA